MQRVTTFLTRVVWWSGWPLLPVLLAFLGTGYAMSDRYGLGRLLDAKTALALHKLLHAPLLVLALVHAVPAVYLALSRWSLKRRNRKA
jgi:hypothetical protein